MHGLENLEMQSSERTDIVAMLEWEEDFSVGVAAMDKQHKQLIAIINELDEAIANHNNSDTVRTILPRLAHYAETHFAAEETLMYEAGFGELVYHQELHQKLTQKVQEYIKQYLCGNVPGIIDMANFLISWLRNHIEGEDKSYGQYIANAKLTGSVHVKCI
jgi:hemerythrin